MNVCGLGKLKWFKKMVSKNWSNRKWFQEGKYVGLKVLEKLDAHHAPVVNALISQGWENEAKLIAFGLVNTVGFPPPSTQPACAEISQPVLGRHCFLECGVTPVGLRLQILKKTGRGLSPPHPCSGFSPLGTKPRTGFGGEAVST